MKTNWGCGAIFGVVLILGVIFLLGLSFLNSGLVENKTGTIIVGFIITSIPIISLVGFISGKFGNRFRWSKRVVALITLVISALGIVAIVIGMRNLILSNLPAEEILNELEGVCQGNGVAAAAGFEPGLPEPYHIVVIKSSGQPDQWSGEAEPLWKPESIQDVELALCLGETRRSLKFGHKKQKLVSSPVWTTRSKLVRCK
jgi:hypothetical protein